MSKKFQGIAGEMKKHEGKAVTYAKILKQIDKINKEKTKYDKYKLKYYLNNTPAYEDAKNNNTLNEDMKKLKNAIITDLKSIAKNCAQYIAAETVRIDCAQGLIEYVNKKYGSSNKNQNVDNL